MELCDICRMELYAVCEIYNFLSYATCYLRQSFSTFLLQYGITPDSTHRRAMTPLLRAIGCARQCEDWTRPLFKGVGCKPPSLSTHWASRVPPNTPASLPFKRHLDRFSRFCRGSRPGHHRDTERPCYNICVPRCGLKI